MKIVKVRIHRGSKGENMMMYPARYDAEEVDREGFGPGALSGTAHYSGGIGRGIAEEHCLIVLEDDLADEYALDPEMEIITAATADALAEQWRVDNHESEIVISHVEEVRYAQEKLARQAERVADSKIPVAEYELTAEELAMLDPDDPTVGINKRVKSINDEVVKRGKTLTTKVTTPAEEV